MDTSDRSKWSNEIEREKEEGRQLGHLKLLIDNGLVEGIYIEIAMNRDFVYSIANPRLTMAGHDLLDTLRSPKLWEKIKSLARQESIELSISAIRFLAEKAFQTYVIS